MARKPKEVPVEVEKISDNITLFSDGKYRWRYDFNLLTNPSIFLLIWKIFFFIMLTSFVIAFFIGLGDSKFFWEGFLSLLRGYGIALAVMTGVSLLGYLVYAAIMGGKYCVEFEMDEKGVLHKQVASQAKKAKKISKATTFAGAASGSITTIGIGRISSTKTSSYSDFSRVKSVRVHRLTRVIKVNELLEHNQVYASKEDFPFVENYIKEHCTNTRKMKKQTQKEKV